MASGGSNKLKIFNDSADDNQSEQLKRFNDSADDNQSEQTSKQEKQEKPKEEKQQQIQQKADISDDEEQSTSQELEMTFSGIEAVKICHFCKTELENLSKYYNAIVTKEPPEGPLTRLIIKGDEKYADDIRRQVKHMQDELKGLTEDVVKLDVTKHSEVKKVIREYGEDSEILIHISPMDFKVYVISNNYDKKSQALHKVNVALGNLPTSTRTGRNEDTAARPKGSNLYPDLSRVDRTEEDMETDENGTQGVTDGKDAAGTDVDQAYRNPGRHGRDGYERRNARAGQYGSSNDDDYFDFTFTFESGFVLKVYKASITKLNVDAIVNAANDNLVHGGGVAAVISQAAGYELDRESKKYVKQNGFLRVGENCLTTAGRLPYQKVIHAVGPQWSNYTDKEKCLSELRDTVFNVLKRSKKEKYETVAMSSISAGIYGVPKELCADMYVLAVSDFAKTEKEFPKELHIIDIDTNILKLVKQSCKKWEADPKSIEISQTLTEYLKDHPDAVWRGGNRYKPRHNRQFLDSDAKMFTDAGGIKLNGLKVKKQKTEPLDWGGQKMIYEVSKSVKLDISIYSGKIEKIKDIDAVLCSTDERFGESGYISAALKKEFGNSYNRNFDAMKRLHVSAKIGYTYRCATGSSTVGSVMHLAMKSILNGSETEMKAYRNGILSVLKMAHRWKFGKVVIPLVGTGLVQTNKDILKTCCKCVLEALSEFLDLVKETSLKEIYLVNSKREITQMMVETFDTAEQSSSKDNSDRSSSKRMSLDGSVQGRSKEKDDWSKSLNETRIYRSHEAANEAGATERSHRNTDDGELDRFATNRQRGSGGQEVVGRSRATDEGRGETPGPTEDKPKQKGNLKIYED